MPNNLENIGNATRQAITETPTGSEHLTIQEYQEDGHKILGWERISSLKFILFLA